MYYFYGKINVGHVVCPLYLGGPYLEESYGRFHCSTNNSSYAVFIMHTLQGILSYMVEGACEDITRDTVDILQEANLMARYEFHHNYWRVQYGERGMMNFTISPFLVGGGGWGWGL